MDDHHHHHNNSRTPLLPPRPTAAAGPWPWLRPAQEEEEELRQALVCAALELESTRAAAQEEVRRLEAHALNLAHVLEITVREREEARSQCQTLLLLLLDKQHQQQQQPQEQLQTLKPSASACNASVEGMRSCVVDEGGNVAVPDASSSGEESSNTEASPAVMAQVEVELETMAKRRPLPEKGRLVEAVMGAGPLLQTLLLAGPLPQWRHPPPPLQSFEIPPVAINMDRRRVEGGDAALSPSPSPPPAFNSSSSSSPESKDSGKYQKMVSNFQL